MAMVKVTFEPAGKTVEVDPAEAPFADQGEPASILDIALARSIEIDHDCGGTGVCGSCHVVIEDGMGNLSEQDGDERDTLKSVVDDVGNHRLACQAVVRGDVTARIPD